MAAADGKDTETYYLAVTAEVLGQTIGYTFVVTYEDGLDLQLQFTWYEKSVTAQTVLCDADKRAALTIKHNQINNSELLYKLGLTGRSAQDAQITSASFNGAGQRLRKARICREWRDVYRPRDREGQGAHSEFHGHDSLPERRAHGNVLHSHGGRRTEALRADVRE